MPRAQAEILVSRTALLLASLILLAPASVRAYTYGDTLTVVWRPLPNLPSFARPGDTLTVWANAPSSASSWSAGIQYAALDVPLLAAGGGWDAAKGRWELLFQVPPGTPEELYDLTLGSDLTPPTTVRHAVKVIPQYRGDFYFAQISDTHLPEHTFSDGSGFSTADTSGMSDFDAVIEDLNLLHPEFIIHTGDIVNEGELEEYLGMYEMGRAQQMIYRLRDPMFLSSGNHDVGGWTPTPPPPGTSRLDWWRYFGWPFLANPPAAEPFHCQDYSFDYGLLHCIGLEAYQNNGSYDGYETNLYGAQSMTQEQMNWLAADVAAVPPGRTKLAFFHYDFGGTLPNGQAAANFSQFNNLTALGLDGVIWGHNHVVAEATAAQLAAHPFNLGIQSVIANSNGGRTFRIFRVHNGTITPGIMHHSGTTTDSLSASWSGPNDGTQSRLSVTVTNRYGETWEHARLVFCMVDHDSAYAATGGSVVETLSEGGVANVYVDCVLPASGSLTVSVAPTAPAAGVAAEAAGALHLDSPRPNPFHPGGISLTVSFTLPTGGAAQVGVFDLAGRRVASLFSGRAVAGRHTVSWDGLHVGGAQAAAGFYVVRLQAAGGERQQKFLLVR